MRVVFAYDGSAFAKRALAYAGRLGPDLEAVVVTVSPVLLEAPRTAQAMDPDRDSDDAREQLDVRNATWIAPYIVGLAVVSYLSSFDTSTKGGPFGVLIGPTNTLHFGWDVLAMAVVSLVVYFLAMRQRLPDDRVQTYIDEVTAEAEAEEREVVTAAG